MVEILINMLCFILFTCETQVIISSAINHNLSYKYTAKSFHIHTHPIFLKMSSLTTPSTLIPNKKSPTISQFSFHPKKKLQLHHDQKYISSFVDLNQVSSKRNCLLYPLKCNAKDNSENNNPEDQGQRAIETVQKLYNSLQNKNLNELYDIIGEECRCISNVASSLQTFYGKEQVINFFNSINKFLGDNSNVEFVIIPTNDGTTVGVAWETASDDTHIPIGKGFGVYYCYYYKGKMTIRNVEIFMEPLLRIEPLRLKISSFLLRAIQKMTELFKGKKKQAIKILSMILLFVALLYLIKNSRNFI
ncbi:hypothetical protein P3L10_033970 [Capsicum annuum]|uniref:uncharacterized protein LOC107851265 n=1 Tax=Capsicum annuum TaxID=4072 RepID=UPI001FB0560D|nr:uncharacterized protein LOC107851265 [Capsicum annuum]